jgi:hypothetical protein
VTLTPPRSLSRGSAARAKGTVTVTFAETSGVKHAVAIAKKQAPARKRRG